MNPVLAISLSLLASIHPVLSMVKLITIIREELTVGCGDCQIIHKHTNIKMIEQISEDLLLKVMQHYDRSLRIS